MTTPKPKRRFFQFSLRSLFVVVTVFCIWFGWKMHEAREQKEAVKWVREMGGVVLYDYEYEYDSEIEGIRYFSIEDAEPPGPKWVEEILGIDFMDDVVVVAMFDEVEVRDLSSLAGLTSLRELFLFGPGVSDLSPLAELTSLQKLEIRYAEASDLSALARLTNLRVLKVSNAPVSDLSPLAGLRNLEELKIESLPVSDVSPLAGLENLRRLRIYDTEVDDIQPLDKLEQCLISVWSPKH